MAQERFLELAIFAVAALLALVGLMMVVGGIFGRTRGSRYEVQRLQARRNAMVGGLKGVGLLAVSALLFGVGYVFQAGSAQPANQPEAEVVPTATEVLATPVPTEVPATPTALPELVVTEPPPPTEQPTNEPPPATPTSTEPEPTPTPTEIPPPTAVPYDAYVDVVGGLNMRDTPNGLITVLLPNGTGMNMLNEAIAAGDFLWQKVESETGDQGWVAEEFIRYESQ